MLSLNSYGCARPLPNNQNPQRHETHVVLPRLALHGGGGLSPPTRTINSLSKVEMMRANEHPLYRTTAGYAS